MASKAQLYRLYFPAWNSAARAQGWRTVKGRFAGERSECFASPALDVVYQRVWNIALQRAGAEIRGLNPDDFRHACHVVALGRDRSSADLDNAQLDRVVALFGLLADPHNLTALVAWDDPHIEQRKRLLWWINHRCQRGYVIALCREKFGTAAYEALPHADLRELHMTLKNRRAAWLPARSPGSSRRPAPAPELANHPF